MPIVSASSTFRQTEFSFFGMPLDPTNRWVRLAKIIPWDMVEDEYVKNFTQTQRGGEARSARFALGTLIIKEQLNLSDQEKFNSLVNMPVRAVFLILWFALRYGLGHGLLFYGLQTLQGRWPSFMASSRA